MKPITIRTYYRMKPLIPRGLQLWVRRMIAEKQRTAFADRWPIDERTAVRPGGWSGWPEGKRFALVITHDVDTQKGHDRCRQVANLDEQQGFRSSFNLVPERYRVSGQLRNELAARGFEIGVHGLYHDGKYYTKRSVFQERAVKINGYLREWGSVGFRSPSMHHNLDWLHDLNIVYDASTFDTDPFEPQPDALGTIFPIWIPETDDGKGFVELPYTLPQDFTLFILLREKNIDIWKRKLDWIVQHGGMALINAHPDYMNFSDRSMGNEEYPAEYYRQFLDHIKTQYAGQYWQALPREIARYWAAAMPQSAEPGRTEASSEKTCLSDTGSLHAGAAMSRKNVLMVVENSFPSDIRVKKEADVIQRSHDVSVVSLRKKRSEPLREVHEGIRIYRIPELPAFNMGKVRYILEYAYFTLGAALVFLLTFPFKRYKVVHVHNPPDTLFIVGLLGRMLGAKFVYDHHDLAPELYLTRFSGRRDIIHKALIWSERLSCRLANAVIDTNESYKKIEMERHGISANKIFTVRNNPIIKDCLLDSATKVSGGGRNGKKRLLFLGAINPQDGVDILLQAVRHLVHDQKRDDFVCTIIGDGDSTEQVRRMAQEL
jgi:hypothetical protein